MDQLGLAGDLMPMVTHFSIFSNLLLNLIHRGGNPRTTATPRSRLGFHLESPRRGLSHRTVVLENGPEDRSLVLKGNEAGQGEEEGGDPSHLGSCEKCLPEPPRPRDKKRLFSLNLSWFFSQGLPGGCLFIPHISGLCALEC